MSVVSLPFYYYLAIGSGGNGFGDKNNLRCIPENGFKRNSHYRIRIADFIVLEQGGDPVVNRLVAFYITAIGIG